MRLLLICLLGVAVVFADGSTQDLTAGSRLFSGDLYNQLVAHSNENILVSPFSAETLFALTQSGAGGATGEEIRSSLHLPDTKEKTEEAFKTILPSFEGGRYILITANKVFVENGLTIKDAFQTAAEDVYQAQFENVEFSESQKTADEINQWVKEQTNDKIQNLVTPDDFNENTRFVLVNALYFHANWTTPFDRYLTNTTRFYTSEDSTIDSVFMYQEQIEYNYADSEELDAQILELPFRGGQASMVVVLPKKKDGIAALEKQIGSIFNTPRFTRRYVTIQMPKFKIESTIDFKDVLQKMGVQKAFTPNEADFSGIAGEKGEIYLSQARQKTYIDVNEYGVEAAAATESGGQEESEPPSIVRFVADHPFVFYIKLNDVILFEGRVLVPEY